MNFKRMKVEAQHSFSTYRGCPPADLAPEKSVKTTLKDPGQVSALGMFEENGAMAASRTVQLVLLLATISVWSVDATRVRAEDDPRLWRLPLTTRLRPCRVG